MDSEMLLEGCSITEDLSARLKMAGERPLLVLTLLVLGFLAPAKSVDAVWPS